MYAIKVVCKEVVDHYGFPIVFEDMMVWLIEGEGGYLDHERDWGNVPEEVLVFGTHSSAERFMDSDDLLWYIKPKSYEIVQLEPVYETKIVGWNVKESK